MRRSLRPLVLTALAAAAAVPARAQVFSNPAPIAIGDPTAAGFADPYPSTVAVSMTGTITDVDVQLVGLRHTFPDDIDILLVGPTGAATLLISDVGGGTDVNGINVILDDEAAGTIPDGGPMVAGTFRPSVDASADTFPAPAPGGPYPATLTTFDTTDPNGTWSLYVVDDTGGDVGRLNTGFVLRITTTTTGPTVIAAPTPIRIHDLWGFGNPNPSPIVVSGAGNTIVSMTVTLNSVTHSRPDDLDFLLVGPTGATFSFASDAGGVTTPINNVTFTLDDGAAIVLPDNTTLTNNTSYQPRNYISGIDTMDTFRTPNLPPYNQAAPAGAVTFTNVFAGTNPNGTWSLYVADDGIGGTGTVAGGWSIDFVLTPVELIDFTIE